MRIFNNLNEAVDEVERELLEMGLDVQSHSMQNIITEGNEDFLTKELMGYSFRVNDIGQLSRDDLVEKKELDQRWIMNEWAERISLRADNPGMAWQWRRDVWQQFLIKGKFDYTYSERINDQMQRVVGELRIKPNSRQAIVQIYNAAIDKENWGGKARIPCSMHYQFMIRNDQVHVLYNMRSSDFFLHFSYDILFACIMAQHIVEKLKRYELGSATFFFGSLHGFRRDLIDRGVF